MTLKRKLSFDFEDEVAYSTKQRKLVPFPNTESDSDITMSDDSASDLPPLSISAQAFHTRLSSTASSVSSTAYSDSPRHSPNYPLFELYPQDESQMPVDPNYFDQPVQQQRPVGLFQPRGTAFTHHGQNCSQIPKLRMACSSGPNGKRTMWAHCEQCGAIEMVDSD